VGATPPASSDIDFTRTGRTQDCHTYYQIAFAEAGSHPDQRPKRKCITFYPDNIHAERSPIQSILYCVGVVKEFAVRPENAIYTRTQGPYASVQRPQWMYLSIKPSAYVIVTDSMKLAPKPPQFPFFPQVPITSMCSPFQLP
jgi:hypothetical protein